ncbi:hypothetical protein GCM10009851_32330 [Herbiconiux moechotypicola]|uniref:Uncharacterized protein n=1 Tax=Herbiconiux moechotypicola TaxID=637393 RepID=A0ABN3DYP5_9MICO
MPVVALAAAAPAAAASTTLAFELRQAPEPFTNPNGSVFYRLWNTGTQVIESGVLLVVTVSPTFYMYAMASQWTILSGFGTDVLTLRYDQDIAAGGSSTEVNVSVLNSDFGASGSVTGTVDYGDQSSSVTLPIVPL